MYTIQVFKKKNSKFPTATHKFNSIAKLFAYFNKLGVAQIEAKEDIELVLYGQLIDPEQGRKKSNFESTTFIVLDIDGIAEEELELALKAIEQYHFIVHSTFSSTEDNLRLRLIAPLAESITLADFEKRKVASCLAALAGIPEIDNVSNNPVQLYYKPSAPIGVEGLFYAHKGQACLSLDDLPKAAQKVKATKSSQKNSNAYKSSDDEDIAEANRGIRLIGGHLFFINNRFYIYDEGIWEALTIEDMVQYLTIYVFNSKNSISNVKSIVGTLQIVARVTKFPKCESGDDVLVLNDCAVNLVTGEKVEHNYSHYATNKLSFNYDETADCPLWENTLRQIWRDDADFEEKILLLQEYFGYSLARDVSFQVMLWLMGEGDNGKSLILSVVELVVGKHNTAAVPFTDLNKRFVLG